MCKEIIKEVAVLNAELGLNTLKLGIMDLEEMLEKQGISFEVRCAIEDVISGMQANVNVINSRRLAGTGMKVRVTGSQESDFWYRDLIDAEYEVHGDVIEEDYEGWIVGECKLVIDKRDCEVIS